MRWIRKYQLEANLLMAECLSAQNKYDLSESYFERVINAKEVSMEQKRKAYYGLGYTQYNGEQYDISLSKLFFAYELEHFKKSYLHE